MSSIQQTDSRIISSSVSDILELRQKFENLKQQLATGRVSETLAGYGDKRSSLLDLTVKRQAASSQLDILSRLNVHLSLVSESAQHMTDVALKATRDLQNFSLDSTGFATQQKISLSRSRFENIITELNGNLDGRFFFSGRAVSVTPVETGENILFGKDQEDGLKTFIQERRVADRGNGMGNLITAHQGTEIKLSQLYDNSVPFGFKILKAESDLVGLSVSSPSGTKQEITFDFTAATPKESDVIRIRLSLPDGSTEDLLFKAKNEVGNEDGVFKIGATASETAKNFSGALNNFLVTKNKITLSSVSAIIAAKDFFAGSVSSPARRIDGPPFETATGFAAPGTRPTLTWYKGDDRTDVTARESQKIHLDSTVINTGARANEVGIQSLLAGLAVVALEKVDLSEKTEGKRIEALGDLASKLTGTQNIEQSVHVFNIEIGNMLRLAGEEKTLYQKRQDLYQVALDGIQYPNIETVSVQISAIRTQIQASYELTRIAGQLSFVNYLR